jgi:hypothetical protein
MFHCDLYNNYDNQVMQKQFKNSLKMVNIVSIFYIESYILKLKLPNLMFMWLCIVDIM